MSERSPWFASVSSVVCWTCHPDASSRRSPGRSRAPGAEDRSLKLVLHEPEGELIAGFIKQVLVQRADADGDTSRFEPATWRSRFGRGDHTGRVAWIVSSAQRSVSDSDVASTGEVGLPEVLDRPCQPDGKIDPRTPSEYGSGMRVVERDASELALRLGSVAGFAGTPTISLSIVYKALTDVSMPVPMLTFS